MKADEVEILVANASAVFSDDGQLYRIIAGKTTARKGARILKGREHLFDPLVVDFDVDPPRRGRPPKAQAEEKVEAFPVDPKPAEPEPTPEPAPDTPSGGITTKSVPTTGAAKSEEK